MGRRTDGEAAQANVGGAAVELLAQRSEIVSAEDGRDGLVGPGEEPVDDLDAQRAVVQGGEGVDETLGAVVALHQRGQILAGADVVALVVHDETVLAGEEQIEDPRHG